MAKTPEFKYAPMFQVGKDDTEYRLLTKDGVTVGEFKRSPNPFEPASLPRRGIYVTP